MKSNQKAVSTNKTHEGAPARSINAEQELRRSVMSCLLWEKEFYEDGEEITARIARLIPQVAAEKVYLMAIEARQEMKLRHIPLFLAREMARHPDHKRFVGQLLPQIVERADELTEMLALYWKEGRKPIANQVKKGLARAFTKFDEYRLAKYNRDSAIKLRDVLFMVRPKPKDEAQDALWKRLIADELKTPDTWEVQLSAGKDKKVTWERLIRENKLGGLALLRNLRNMQQVGVSDALIGQAILTMKTDRILPFRFIAAARYAPQFEPLLEKALFRCIQGMPKLSGKTVCLIDVSGSMDDKLSSKSDMMRLDAACGLAMVLREICADADLKVLTFSETIAVVPPRRGFALRDAIVNSQPHGGTYLGKALKALSGYDRIIVITDEQSHDSVPGPRGKGYMINVASAKNGVGYGPWVHIDGFSEAIVKYIQTMEG